VSTRDVIMDALIAVAILNLIVSVAVGRSTSYNGRQKILQVLMIWVFPVIGGLLLGLFLLSQRGNSPPMGYASADKDDLGQIWSGLHPPDEKH
jgi:hypothetical protein